MNTPRLVALIGACLAGPSIAQTTQTIGPGSAVPFIDRTADFNALAVNGTPLSDYSEGGLFIRTDGDSWIGDGNPVRFDPFHGANGSDFYFYCPYGGSQGYTTIETTDSSRIYALEFMYGNGWTTGQIYGPFPWGDNGGIVDWKTYRGNTLVSSGFIGNGPVLEMGTIVGFSDPAGFDRLLIRCTHPNSGDPNLQVLCLDDLHVQITAPPPCYANCDASTTAPVLNVLDFSCFLNKFAAGDPYANCDASTTPPVLNVLDFSCFLNRFTAGCP